MRIEQYRQKSTTNEERSQGNVQTISDIVFEAETITHGHLGSGPPVHQESQHPGGEEWCRPQKTGLCHRLEIDAMWDEARDLAELAVGRISSHGGSEISRAHSQ